MEATATDVTVETGLGSVTVAWRDGVLTTVSLGALRPRSGAATRWAVVTGEAPNANGRALVDALQRYFGGQPVAFEAEMALTGATEFQLAVWRAAGDIPHGETRTYGWLAERIGRPKASRAVGAALGRNPVPIVIPCHRVLGANGALTGFGYGLGWKQALLDLERASGRADRGRA